MKKFYTPVDLRSRADMTSYLEKHFRETFSLVGTPLRIELRSGKNPFAKD